MGAVETRVPEAYDLVLQGLARYAATTKQSMAEARGLYRKAIELDPGYARAYANMALAYASDINFNWADDRGLAIKYGLEYASKAVALDDTIPQIYMTRSILFLARRKFDAAMQAALHMIDVHPNYADGYATLAFIQGYSREYDQSLAAIRRANEINPKSTAVFRNIEARTLYLLGRYQEALPLVEEAVARNAEFQVAQLLLAAVHVRLGQVEDAEWAVSEALAVNPSLSIAQLRHNSIYKYDEDLERFIEDVRAAGLPEGA